jgi:hypothetical protein
MEKKSLSPQVLAALEKANQYLSIGHYSPPTIRNYLAELRFIFAHYPDVDPYDALLIAKDNNILKASLK